MRCSAFTPEFMSVRPGWEQLWAGAHVGGCGSDSSSLPEKNRRGDWTDRVGLAGWLARVRWSRRAASGSACVCVVCARPAEPCRRSKAHAGPLQLSRAPGRICGSLRRAEKLPRHLCRAVLRSALHCMDMAPGHGWRSGVLLFLFY